LFVQKIFCVFLILITRFFERDKKDAGAGIWTRVIVFTSFFQHKKKTKPKLRFLRII